MVRFIRSFDVESFTKRWPRPHLVVAHLDSGFTPDEAKGHPSWLDALTDALATVDVAGAFAAHLDEKTGTLRFAFARGEDAARLCALVRATPEPTDPGCVTMACFSYSRRLYDTLRSMRDAGWSRLQTQGSGSDHVPTLHL